MARRPLPNSRARRVSLWRAERGFTLLEMLVAVTALSLLMIALAQGVRTGIQIWNAQASRIAAPADFDAGVRVLREILTTVPIEPAALGAPVSIDFKGRSDRLTLVGRLPTGLGATRLVDMTIARMADRVVIFWSPHRHENADTPAQSTTTELIRNVQHLEFAYLGRPRPSAPASWQSGWDGPALPDLIRIGIELGDREHPRRTDFLIAPQL